MKVSVNGESRDLEGATNVEHVVRSFGARGAVGVAVALNGEVVPKSEWGSTTLNDGDRIEVLNAIGGG